MKKAKVTKIIQETPSTNSIYLHPEENETFRPGQFITLLLNIDGEKIKRSYSFSSAPHEDWRLTIKKVDGGKASNYLHDQLSEGDTIYYEGPEGLFHFENSDKIDQFVLLAAGSGITPIMSMLKSELAKTEKPVSLFYGNKNLKESIFLHQLNDWVEDNDNFDLRLFLSRPGLKQVLFSKKQPYFKGRISSDHILGWLKSQKWDLNKTAFYICGPGEMNAQMKLILSGAGVPDENIKMEYFTSLSEDTSIIGTSKIKFKLMGVEQEVEINRGQAILDGLLDAGFDPPYSCTSGTCCTCMAHLTKGEVKMERADALSNREQKQGFILTCQARPLSEEVELSYDLD